MNLLFELEQSITLTDLIIRDESSYDTESTITGYKIEYKSYSNYVEAEPLVYEITESTDITKIPTGLYIPMSSFHYEGEVDPVATILEDDAYTFTITVTYDTDDDIGLTEETTVIACLYQDVYNIYSQVHLDYDWTSRYREYSKDVLTIASEMTWIEGLKLASTNLGRTEEFVFILGNLKRYFTTAYDY